LEPESSLLLAVSAVAVGGAIGALLRFGMNRIIGAQIFPWATLIVNVTGCFLASFLIFGFGTDMSYGVRSFLFVGVFDAFTTMSAMNLETVDLMAAGNYAHASPNMPVNAGLCLPGAIPGRMLVISLIY